MALSWETSDPDCSLQAGILRPRGETGLRSGFARTEFEDSCACPLGCASGSTDSEMPRVPVGDRRELASMDSGGPLEPFVAEQEHSRHTVDLVAVVS